MKLTSMKRSKAETKKERGEVSADITEEEYPYGLQIDLQADSLHKLGIDITKIGLGQKIRLECETEVKSISISEREGRTDHKALCLQITSMGVDITKAKSKFKEFTDLQTAGPGGQIKG